MKVGILGFAHGHVGMYCTEWQRHPEQDIQVVAGWDHDAARLHKAAATFGARPYADVGALLAERDLAAVVIGAETSLHAELVEKAAAAGKAIVLQKPLALTMAEGDRIVTAVQKHGAPFTVAWQMRVDPQNIKIRELMASGILGKIVMVRRRHALAVHTWPNWRDLWHIKPQFNRDIWADDAAHPIDFMHWLLGAPESVTAEIDTLLDPVMPMDNGIAILRYPGGPVAEVCCSFTCVAAENTTEVIGDRGTIIQSYGDAPSSSVPRPEGACGLKWYTTESKQWTCSDIPSPTSQGQRIAALSAPLSDFLHGERPALATAEDARLSLRMTLACHVSTREGRRVRLDDPLIALL